MSTSSINSTTQRTAAKPGASRVEEIASDLATIPPYSESEPSDGGVRAWLAIAGAFFVWFNSWGAINAYGNGAFDFLSLFRTFADIFPMNHVGVFQSYYETYFLASHSASEIAFVGSVQNFLVLFVGFLSGPLYDAGYASHLLLSGVLLTVLGTMALSLAHHGHYYQVFLSQAVCVGLGWGLMFTPTASIPSRFFKKKLPLAAGLASAGTGVGGLAATSTAFLSHADRCS